MDKQIQNELEELQKLSEAERDEIQLNRLEELTKLADAEKTAEKSKELQSALAQKEHFREKAEKFEARVKELEEKANPNEPFSKGETPQSPLDIVKLGKALNKYDETEVDFIIRNAQDKSPEGIIKASQDEWVKDAIQARREKVAKEQKIPAPSAPSGTASSIDVTKIVKEGERSIAESVAKKVAELEARERGGGI